MTPKSIQRASGLPLRFKSVGPSPGFQRVSQPPTEACWDPLGPEGRAWSQRLFLNIETFALNGFGLAWNPAPLPLFLFLLFGMEMSRPVPPLYFGST